jgi:hypothetical protein
VWHSFHIAKGKEGRKEGKKERKEEVEHLDRHPFIYNVI